jgi:hypothetical protein
MWYGDILHALCGAARSYRTAMPQAKQNGHAAGKQLVNEDTHTLYHSVG